MTANESAHRGRFFKNNYRALVAYVRQCIDDSADRDGEDIVQDVMVNLFNKADVTEPIQNLTGYLYASLRNRIIDTMRGRKKTLSLDAENGDGDAPLLKDMLRDGRGDALQTLEDRDRRSVLYAAIDALGDDEKAIVVATEFDDRSFKDLSEEWETPLGTLLSRKSRAIKHIGDFMRDRGFENH
jgi:RNA polymerase sigma factor (sigma-70 family)